jgi:hypothetical protein
LALFRVGTETINWTPHQYEIIQQIIYKEHNRVQCIAVTQYGKSLAVACALIIDAAVKGEKWAIVAPNADKAGIIMGYVIEHLFDSPMFTSQLMYELPIEQLKKERNKSRITFKNGGEVRIYSADAKNRQNVIKSLTGFGSKNVVLDESSLIPNDLYAMVKRMLGGHKDNFLFEIGNPFQRNHFLRTWQGGQYHRIYIDYLVALKEGRFTPEYIEEMKGEAFFDILYGCVFPAESEILEGGWRHIISRAEIEKAMTSEWNPEGRGRLGVDIAGGGADYTVVTVKFDNIARIVAKWKDKDIMAQIPIIEKIMHDYNIDDVMVFIDDTAIGQGLTNRMQEMGYAVNGVRLGNSATDNAKYVNVRTENHWLGSQWIKQGGKIYINEYSDEMYEFSFVNYKEDTTSKLKLEPKQEMMTREGIKSPDVLDSFILAFTSAVVVTSNDFSF